MARIEDGTNGAILASVSAPTDSLSCNIKPYVSATLGTYQKTMTVSNLGPVVTAGAVLFAFRYTGANLAVVEKVTCDGVGVTTAFTAGQAMIFRMFAARSYTVSQTTNTTAATLTGNNAKLRTSYATCAADIRITSAVGGMTGATRTLDTDAMGATVMGLVGAGTMADECVLFDSYGVGHPYISATNEGFEILNQVVSPAAGTMSFSFTVRWSEITAAEWGS